MMSEIQQKLEVYKVNYQCDEESCDGVVTATGIVLMSNPPLYEHSCSICRKTYRMKTNYPTTITKATKENV